jgi:hypothetical protein
MPSLTERVLCRLIWGTNPDGWRLRGAKRDLDEFIAWRTRARRYLLALIRLLTSLARQLLTPATPKQVEAASPDLVARDEPVPADPLDTRLPVFAHAP